MPTAVPVGMRNARLARRVTQEELAARIGRSRPYVNRIEHETVVPSLPTALRLVSVLGPLLFRCGNDVYRIERVRGGRAIAIETSVTGEEAFA